MNTETRDATHEESSLFQIDSNLNKNQNAIVVSNEVSATGQKTVCQDLVIPSQSGPRFNLADDVERITQLGCVDPEEDISSEDLIQEAVVQATSPNNSCQKSLYTWKKDFIAKNTDCEKTKEAFQDLKNKHLTDSINDEGITQLFRSQFFWIGICSLKKYV